MDTPGTPTLAQGRYRLVEVLGQGGMATVYRAVDSRLGVERAIKVLEPAFVRSNTIRARFETEARTMARLSHPNILQVFDVAEDEQRVFIVMNLADRGSLWDRVEELGPLPPSLACGLLAAVCDAVQLAHDHGVVHRDIKPQNILLSADATPLLTDFGIAQVHDPAQQQSLTRTGTVMGTWGYMPPEQRSSARDADARTDVYALGATLYALVVGSVPPDLFAASMDAGLLSDLEPDLADLIARATRYHREERTPSAGALAAELRTLAATLPPPDATARDRLVVPLTQTGGQQPHPDSGSGRVGAASGTDGGTVAGLLDETPASRLAPSRSMVSKAATNRSVGASGAEPVPSRRGRLVGATALVAALLLGLAAVVFPTKSSVESIAPASRTPPAETLPSSSRPMPVAAPAAPPPPEAPPMEAETPNLDVPEPPGATPSKAPTKASPVETETKRPVAPGPSAPPETAPDEERVPAADPPSAAPAPAPLPAQVQVRGSVSDVALLDPISGAEHLPGQPLPAGTYEVLARFSGSTQRTVALRVTLEPGQQVVLNCDDIFDKCGVQP